MSWPVADPWWRVTPMGDGVTMFLEPHVHVLEQANMWLVEGRDRDMVIDAGMGIAPFRPVVDAARADRDKPLILVLSHAHIDHIGSADEFDARLIHAAEAEDLRRPPPLTLRADSFGADALRRFAEAGYPPLPEWLIDAVPAPDYDPAAYVLRGCAPTGLLAEGDVVDLGDRAFEVLHLPGHSPGGVGLWDAERGVLFAGDAIYDGPLIYDGPGMSVPDYAATLERLMALPAQTVHGGHDPSFGRERMRAICADYLRRFSALR